MILGQLHTILRQVALLRDFDDAELRTLWQYCRIREQAAGSTIMKAGEPGDTMFFFLDGVVDVWPGAAPGKGGPSEPALGAKPHVRLKAATVSLFGEMAMLSDAPRSATIAAVSDCILYELSREDFERLCDESPRLGIKLLRGIAAVLAARVRKGNDDQLKLWKALARAEAKGTKGREGNDGKA